MDDLPTDDHPFADAPEAARAPDVDDAPERHASPVPIPDDTPLDVVVDRWSDAGFEGQFRAEPEAMVRCLTCGATSSATEHGANRVTRLEGPSDPADEQIVVPLRCPNCGTTGTLIANYGPEVGADEAEVLMALRRDAPAERADPGHTAPPG